MATPLVLRLSVLLGLLLVAANARPGNFHPSKTLIFFTTSTSAAGPLFEAFPQNPSFAGRRSFTVYSTEILQMDLTEVQDRPLIEEEKENEPFPFGGLYSSIGASFRDRTKDILRVVESLIFGVFCGANAAAALYLIWSLFAESCFDCQESDDEFDSDDDVSPKKVGYVPIPASEELVPAKEDV